MKKYLLSLFIFLFAFCLGIAFADTFNNFPQNVRVGNLTFALPNGFGILGNTPDGTIFCGDNITGELITFISPRVFYRDTDIEANSYEAIKALAKELNSDILKIDRFEFNGKIIIATREQDNNGKVAKAYFVRDKKIYVIEFTQKPVPKYGHSMYRDDYRYNNYIEDYEHARNLLISIINSAR